MCKRCIVALLLALAKLCPTMQRRFSLVHVWPLVKTSLALEFPPDIGHPEFRLWIRGKVVLSRVATVSKGSWAPSNVSDIVRCARAEKVRWDNFNQISVFWSRSDADRWFVRRIQLNRTCNQSIKETIAGEPWSGLREAARIACPYRLLMISTTSFAVFALS